MFMHSIGWRCLFAVLLGASITAQAGSLSVSPVVVTLDEKSQNAAITLKNEGTETRVVQTELLRWTQENGENIHAPSRDILINPPIATLRPGQTQIIRIGLNRKVDSVQELAYRLYISEIPPPPKEGFTGLRIALRLGLAVFVSPRAKPTDKPDWKGARDQKGDLQLTLRNSGNRRLRLTSLEVRDPEDGRQLAELQQRQLTLLAGQARRLSMSLPSDWRGKDVRLIAGTEEGLVDTRVKLEAPAN
jgi:fimbrial chaperone protein